MRLQIAKTDHPIGKLIGQTPPNYQKVQTITLIADTDDDTDSMDRLAHWLTDGGDPGTSTTVAQMLSRLMDCTPGDPRHQRDE